MKIRKVKRTAAAIGLSLMLVLAGCGGQAGGNAADSANAEKSAGAAGGNGGTGTGERSLQIQTSFYPIYEFTRQVAGDLAQVELLVPGGVEPHDWEPSPQDIRKLAESDLLIVNGAGMESWLEQVEASAASGKLVIVEASEGITLLEGGEEEEHGHNEEGHTDGKEPASDADADAGEAAHNHEHDHDHEHEHEHGHDHDHEAEHSHNHSHNHGHDHDHGGLDPHVWLSPALAVQEVRSIEAALAKADPEHAADYKQNADAYAAQLEQLDREFAEGLTNAKRKDFITQHAAFGYLAREYGLTQVPIAGLSPDQEPSAEQMTEIVKFAKEHQVKTIFFETLVSSKVAETIAREIGAKTAVLNPIEGLTAEDEAAGRNYVALMRQNLEALKAALNE
ncbi:metal ABC transporter substrate-binding protein [Paenibacillus phocaensis]|uniref:metal ABC transporter substrate-binding protein n=1 Tax=Paenibacillus phocaensis TaxID=1776378 RepID=UPI000839D39C|nr:metal ABC transporter substrate-binding protein [Paenibacillus phocaensis]